MRRLNVKLVAILSTASVLMVVMVAVVHGWQMKRTSHGLLVQSQEAEKDGDLEKAASLLKQYVEYKPEDAEQGAKLAILMVKIANEPNAGRKKAQAAHGVIEAQLRLHLERDDIRRAAVDFYIKNYAFHDAIDHIKPLLNNDDIDDKERATLLRKLGECQWRTDSKTDAKDALEKAIALDDHQEQAYLMLASIMREDAAGSPEDADKIMSQLVEKNPDSAKAYLMRAEYLARYYKPSGGQPFKEQQAQAEADMKRALELDPNDAGALLAGAGMALRDKQPDLARKYLEHGNEIHPNDTRFLEQLVYLDAQNNQLEKVTDRLANQTKNANLTMLELDIKLMQRDLEGAAKLVEQAKKAENLTPPEIDYMQACLMIANQKWLEASHLLERNLPLLPSGYEVHVQTKLGECYEMLGESDRQFEAFRKAVTANPANLYARLGLVRAMRATGKIDEAYGELERLKHAMGVDEFVKRGQGMMLIELLLQRIGQLPPEERDWKEVEELAAATKRQRADAPELLLIDAMIEDQKGNTDESQKMMEAAVEKNPQYFGGWMALVRAAFLKDGPEAALQTIARATEKTGDTAALRSMRLSFAAQLPPAEASKQIAAVATGLDKFTPDEQKRLLRAVGAAYMRAGDEKNARRVWTQVAEASPKDPVVQFTLFDIAVRTGDEAEINSRITQIKEMFGTESAEAKLVEARRILNEVRSKRGGNNHNLLAQARKIIHQGTEKRPNWAALARCEGEIDMMDGKIDEAIEDFKRAYDRLGETDSSTARQIAQLLILRGRSEEARHYMKLASSKAGNAEESADDMLPVGLALADRDLPKATKLLERAHDQDPQNVQKTIALCQVLIAAGQRDKTEKLLRELVEIQPTESVGWFELVKFLTGPEERRFDEARQVVADAQTKLEKDKVDILSGQCYEMIHDLPAAEKSFRQAVENNPNDLGMKRALATFYLRTKNEEQAKVLLEELLKTNGTSDSDKEHAAWANRELAVIIAGGGTYRDFRTAMDRLKSKDSKTLALADKAVMAKLLATRPDADSRIQATHMLEEIKRETTMPPTAQMLLAQLYEATGNWPKAREEMLSLLGGNKQSLNPDYVAYFVAMLLRNNDLGAAGVWLSTLEQLAPDSPVTVAFRARLLVKQGKSDEAVSRIKALLPRPLPRDKLYMLGEIGQLLEQIDQPDAAEEKYREYAALDPLRGQLLLAGFLGRTRTLKDSLDVCQNALEAQQPLPIVVREALRSLRERQRDATKDDFRRVEGWITRGIAKYPKELSLRLNYTELLDIQGRYPELEEMYKSLLKLPEISGAERAFVLNNLAYLLALQGKAEEARRYIDEAVQIFGPLSDLLDTRAMVFLAEGKTREAIDDLQMSLVDQPTGMKYFHLARAQMQSRNNQAANEAMRKALEDYHLKANDLSPQERGLYKEIADSFGLSTEQAEKPAIDPLSVPSK